MCSWAGTSCFAGEIVAPCYQCNSHLCSFMMFMTGFVNVVKQYYDEVGRGRWGFFLNGAPRGISQINSVA